MVVFTCRIIKHKHHHAAFPCQFSKKFIKTHNSYFPSQAIKNFSIMENMKQKVIWSMTVISKYKSNLNSND